MKEHGFDFVTYHLHATLFQILGLRSEHQAASLFALLSVLSGLIYIAVAVWGMRTLYGWGAVSVLGLALLVLSPGVLLFFGYAECYGPLAVALLWFGIALVRHYREDRSLFHVGLPFAVAVFLHPNALFLTPALIATVLFPRDQIRWMARISRTAILLLFPIGALTAGAARLAARGGHLSLTKTAGDIGGMLRPLTGDASVLSFRHLKDVLNLALLVTPAPMALLLTASSQRGEHPAPSQEMKPLALGIIGLGAVAACVNMRLGMVRDWDILAPHASLVALAALSSFSRKVEQAVQAKAAGLVAVAMVFLLVPWLAVNAGSASALERFRHVIRDLGPYARAYAHEEMARFERDRGNTAEALEEYEHSVAAFPDNPRLQLSRADLMFRTGREAEAIGQLEACVKKHPAYIPALRALAWMHLNAGRPDRALELARALQNLTNESTEDANVRGLAAERLGLYEEALAAFGWALNLSPLRADIAQHLVAAMIRIEGVASTQARLRTALAARPTSATRICLAIALWMPLREKPEAWAAAAAQADIREARLLLDSIPDRDREVARLRNMEAEVNAALDIRL